MNIKNIARKIGHDDLLVVTNFIYGVKFNDSPIKCFESQRAINNIVKFSEKFSNCIVANDEHTKECREFRHMPPHAIKGTSSAMALDEIKAIGKNVDRFLLTTKEDFDASKTTQLRLFLLGHQPNRVFISGFCTCMDILATCLGFLSLGYPTYICTDCVSDTVKERQDEALSLLKWIGVEIYESFSVL